MSSGVKLAVAPMIQILGAGAAQALPPSEGRTQFGLPVSVEITRGPARLFGSTGFFSRGAWYAGGGTAAQVSPRLAMSLSFSRAWASDGLTGLVRDRRDLSGGASYFVRPALQCSDRSDGRLRRRMAMAREQRSAPGSRSLRRRRSISVISSGIRTANLVDVRIFR
jgi:hypothetical protein